MTDSHIEKRPKRWQDFQQGAIIALEGMMKAWKKKRLLLNPQDSHLRRQIMSWILVCVVISILAHILLLFPVSVASMFMHMFRAKDMAHDVDRFHASLSETTRSLPLLTLIAFQRAWSPSADRLFLHSAQTLIEDKAVLIKLESSKPTIIWMSELRDYLRQLYRRLQISVFYFFITMIPVFGRLAVPLIAFYLTYKSLGRNLAVLIAVLSILPGVSIGSLILDFIQDSRMFGREFFEPWFRRQAMKPKHKREWLRRHGWVVTGFAVIWTSLIILARQSGIWGLSALIYLCGQVVSVVLVEQAMLVFGNDVEEIKIVTSNQYKTK